MISKIKIYLVILGVIIVIGSALYAWYKKPSVITRTEYVEIPKIKEVIKIKTIKVPVKEIVTIEKEAVIKKLNLPDFATGPDKQIIATGVVDAYEGDTNVIAVMNTQSGTSEIIAKRKPLRFFAFQNKKRIGMRYGFNTVKGQGGELYGEWTFFRVGAVYVAAYASINELAQAKAMLDVSYRW